MNDITNLANVSSVLFVCMGNICRSPTAEAVFKQQATLHGLSLKIDSAGTIAFHQGNAPDTRSMLAGRKRGLDFSGMKARQVVDNDFEVFDLILVADEANLIDLYSRCPAHLQYKIRLILSFVGGGVREVPDPYYGGDRGFELVIDLLEISLAELAKQLVLAKAG
ncbi:low molecular weight protein-tyrosine-phosphatase [Shewanella ulleungensis]|jgi:protein-tyrosine phosphatase|uniref:protein-tyrosine-phosphatase n=1 Tax=Shewanella ulleungensis TaxID=2282699 RepID=A0ABQ2QIM1_9GAMM|nr:low molecular weight protein-tyrosine-phosphatase [Shewanella ulleungensis]MCL1151828.1 low molecular weight phosphotyrosine protein phosphatase [Shewanella ulleungensis]GGP83354.1 protein-tyrosine-phosphatase [Shewanella ulleungensis]